MGQKVVAVIAAHNEEVSIQDTLEILNSFRQKRLLDEIVVVNDGSTDRTAEIARRFGAVVASHSRNQGKRACFITGAFKARELGASTMFMLDADIMEFPEQTFRKMVSSVTSEGKLMAIAQQFEESPSPKEVLDGVSHYKVNNYHSNAQRAFSISALEPLFRNNKKWVSLLTSKAHKFLTRTEKAAGSKWGLEFALDYLIPAGKAVFLQEFPVCTRPAFRKNSNHGMVQEQGRGIVKMKMAERKNAAKKLWRLRARKKFAKSPRHVVLKRPL
ncbi:MAG: glycosyltransferase [Candidatus Diapherotrites archaeon]|nr:glycosyltransferase [Candidatus Diapherotrites archaeon]